MNEPRDAEAQDAETPDEGAVDVRETARRMTGLAMNTLRNVMRGKATDSAKLAAAREVLDRAGGKPRTGEVSAVAGPVTVTIRRFGADGRELEPGEEG